MNSERPSCAHACMHFGGSQQYNYTSLYALALMCAYTQRCAYAPDFIVVCTPSVVHIMYIYTALWLCPQMRPLEYSNTQATNAMSSCYHGTAIVLHKKISWRFKISANWRATATYVGMVVE